MGDFTFFAVAVDGGASGRTGERTFISSLRTLVRAERSVPLSRGLLGIDLSLSRVLFMGRLHLEILFSLVETTRRRGSTVF